MSSESSDPPEEKELALAFHRGEPDAYRAIYERYEARVNGICRRLLNDPHDAQEASQEVFTRVYQALPRFNGRYQLGAWIVRITTNVCLDQIRSRSRHPFEATPVEELQLDVEDAPSKDEPESVAIRRAESRHVRRVLAGLPPMHRAAIVLRDFEGLSYQEVSIALGITECQTKALIHRARQNFKRTWSPLDALQVILPWKFVQKKMDVGSSDGAAQVARASAPLTDAASSAAQVAQAASSCSVAFHQCGQFMAERATALAATVIVGTAAIGGVAAGRVATDPVEPPSAQVVTESSLDLGLLAQHEKKRTKEIKPSTKSPRPARHSSVPTTEPVPTPSEEPTPSASPTPEPAPSGSPTSSGSAGGKKSDGSPSEPAPPPFHPALGFVQGSQQPPVSSVSGHSFTLDCANTRFEQTLNATVSFEGKSYLASLGLRLWGQTGRMEITLLKDGREIRYSSWGKEPSAAWSKSSSTVGATLSGEYGPVYGTNDPTTVGLPASGNFQAELTFDCAASRVTTQRVAFGTS